MRVAVDCQYLQQFFGRRQTADLFYEALKTLHQLEGIEFYLILNLSLMKSSKLDFSLLRDDFGSKNIHFFAGSSNVGYVDSKNKNRALIFEIIREGLIKQFRPDLVLMLGVPDYIYGDATVCTSKANSINPTVVIVQEVPDKTGDKLATYPDIECLDEVLFTFKNILNKGGYDDQKEPRVKFDFSSPSISEPLMDFKKYITEVVEKTKNSSKHSNQNKKRLAYVSPLPPRETGISDYSLELLTPLSSIYNIDVVVDDDFDLTIYNGREFGLIHGSDFLERAKTYERVIYHFGNSHFHDYMLPLLEKAPGVVLLHDYYLGHFIAGLSERKQDPSLWEDILVRNYGYRAVIDKLNEPQQACMKYPANEEIITRATGVMLHSEFSRNLLTKQVGDSAIDRSCVVPFIKEVKSLNDKLEAKMRLGFEKHDKLICSFGFLGEAKFNKELVDAWISSTTGKEPGNYLIFVGGGDYKSELESYLREKGCEDRVLITGFIDSSCYNDYLSSADVAVQLRQNSRGESSAALMDCLASGIPTIANSHGSAAELPKNCLRFLKDDFSSQELSEAINELIGNEALQDRIRESAKEYIFKFHNPNVCANAISNAIETFEEGKHAAPVNIAKRIAKTLGVDTTDSDMRYYATKLGQTFGSKVKRKTIFLDVSITAKDDYRTGIQRVVRAICKSLIEREVIPSDYLINPVCISEFGGEWHYRSVPEFSLGLFGLTSTTLKSYRVEPGKDDIILNLDFTGHMLVSLHDKGFYKQFMERGVHISSIIYDLLPMTLPDMFPEGAAELHEKWVRAISSFDSAICISETVALEYKKWRDESFQGGQFDTHWFHLGADVDSSAPTRGLPRDANTVLSTLKSKPTFLMVGTIEPRKGYRQVIEAFTLLWNDEIDVNLVIVGQEGWKALPDSERKEIPELVRKLSSHDQLNNRLFWLNQASDEYLNKIYESSSCLIAASYGEGFGLPLIEAAQHKLPILARNIPIFNEVAERHAHYFSSDNPSQLAEDIKLWLERYRNNSHIKAGKMHWLTWNSSTSTLLKKLTS